MREAQPLFPTDLPPSEWVSFRAAGFANPVCGVIFRDDDPPCCGMSLGGVGVGCLDIDVRGVYGFSSIFNPKSQYPISPTTQMPRKLPRPEPMLGLAVGDKVWVLASQELINGGEIPWCTEPMNQFSPDAEPPHDMAKCCKIENVASVKNIHYWGHFPVADMIFDTDAPVSVALRTWAPFLPGDTISSNMPAAVFEVHLQNTSSQDQQGTLAFNFPGPDAQEAMSEKFNRRNINEDITGVEVCSEGGVSYVIGALDTDGVRLGAGLGKEPQAWSQIATALPEPTHEDAGASAAMDFALAAGREKVVRFVLAWHAPEMEGAGKTTGAREDLYKSWKIAWLCEGEEVDTHWYTHMYATRFSSALDAARHMASHHQSLLTRVLAWQTVIYEEETYPIWLRDVLINTLALIAEDSYWFQGKPPLGDWSSPNGAFGLNESPRGCPQMDCIGCDWMGGMPIVYFFPELAHYCLRPFREYQLEDGEVPFAIGKLWDLPDLASPEYFWQVSLSGIWYLSRIDRLWRRTGDDNILKEFYESAKRCNTFVMNLSSGPHPVISMPDRGGSEAFEYAEWRGMVTHVGGMHLAQLRIMERMAEHMDDNEYAEQCRRWFKQGSDAMEEHLWVGTHYLNYLDPETGDKTDDVLAMQLDGDLFSGCHSLEPVFRADRARITLETVERCNIPAAPDAGALTWVRPDGSLMEADQDLTEYGRLNVFPACCIMLAATYLYAGKKETGMELARNVYANIVLKQKLLWDMPNILRGDNGIRVYGTDYSQMMIAWMLPAALAGEDLAGPCRPGALVHRILEAARAT